MRTGMGPRTQPLMVAATTAGDDPDSWPKSMHDSYEKVAEDAAREPHTHVFMRNLPSTVEELERLWEQYPAHPELPVSVDPFDEANWRWTNPALGDFLSIQVLRQEALEASNDPLKENAFRQFRVNQWVSQVTRWMPMHLYDHPDNVGEVWATPDWGRAALEGRTAYAGFDLAAKFDLCAWCLAVPDDEWNVDFLWRFWLPEGGFTALNKKLSGMLEPWRRDGWLTVNDGDVVDYDQLYNDIQADAEAVPYQSDGRRPMVDGAGHTGARQAHRAQPRRRQRIRTHVLQHVRQDDWRAHRAHGAVQRGQGPAP
jgi:phage terminase large subunit-like protein